MKETRGLLSMGIEAPGLDEMIAKLQKYAAIGDTDAKRVRAGMNQTVKLVRGQAEQSVPFKTGELKGSLFGKTKTWSEGNVTGNVGSGWTMPKALIPFTLEGGRKANFRGRMAIAPRRWLYHAYSRVKEQVDAIWVKVLEQITKDLAGKG
jgi:hypothetical protein